MQKRIADRLAHERAALTQHGVHGARRDQVGAVQRRLGAEPDAFDPEQAGHVVLQTPGRITRPHQRENRVLYAMGEAVGSPAAGRSAGPVPPRLLEHRGHVVRQAFAMQAARRLEDGIKLGVGGEPARVGAQVGGDQTVAILADGFRLPLQSRQCCVIQNYGLSPLRNA